MLLAHKVEKGQDNMSSHGKKTQAVIGTYKDLDISRVLLFEELLRVLGSHPSPTWSPSPSEPQNATQRPTP